jgi:hypothetical protein
MAYNEEPNFARLNATVGAWKDLANSYELRDWKRAKCRLSWVCREGTRLKTPIWIYLHILDFRQRRSPVLSPENSSAVLVSLLAKRSSNL